MLSTVEKVRQLTAPVIAVLAQSPSVVGLLCFGSYALEVYDAHSDIDLYVLCAPEIIPEARRETIFAGLPGSTELQVHQTHAGWVSQWSPQADRLVLNQMPIELSYNTQSWVTNVVRQVTKEGALSLPEFTFRPYTLLGLLATAIVLYDPLHVIAQLKATLAPYPPKLQAALIREKLPILHEWMADLQDCAQRELGVTSFLFYLWHICDALHALLFAINETYDPAAKRAEHELAKLPLAPRHFMARYTKLLEGPFTPTGQRHAASDLASLVTETIELIPMPERKPDATAPLHLS
ncbi:MAG: hypothetical protein NT075_15045 [Chloroflexi bacterium]|nr:hypothetical protein [Chloroflexota bacterium]